MKICRPFGLVLKQSFKNFAFWPQIFSLTARRKLHFIGSLAVTPLAKRTLRRVIRIVFRLCRPNGLVCPLNRCYHFYGNTYQLLLSFKLNLCRFLSLKLAGVAGFEPTHARVKVSCLTTWRHPTIFLRVIYSICKLYSLQMQWWTF